MSKTKKLVGLILMAMVIVSTTSIAMAQKGSLSRLYGQNRIETSAKIASEHKGTNTLNSVIVASAYNFPDSLGATILSSKYNAPILLIGKDESDSAKTIEFIKTNLSKSGNIYVLGGEGAISENLLDSIKKEGYSNFIRLAGNDRYETNLAILNYLKLPKGNPVIIANGTMFPDALSMSPVSSINGYPILLTEKTALSSETLKQIEKLQPTEVYIAGGFGAVLMEIENQIKSVSPNSKIERISGIDRYDTSRKIAERFSNIFGDKAIVASGENFPDALSGSSLANKNKSPILLANDSILNYSSFLVNKGIKDATILGGTAVVSSNVENELNSIINGSAGTNSGGNSSGNTSGGSSGTSSGTNGSYQNVNYQETSTMEYSVTSVSKDGSKATMLVTTNIKDTNQLQKLSLMLSKFVFDYNSDISQVIINYNNGSYVFDSSTVK